MTTSLPPRRSSDLIADLTFTSGKVPRGVTAAGVPLGGLTPDAADQRLQSVVAPRAAQPIAVTMATVQAEVDPRRIGLTVDSRATRSEEHTSELQSLMRTSYAVFGLKKTKST